MSEGVDRVGGLRPTLLRIGAALGALRLWLFIITVSIFSLSIAFNQLLKISVEYKMIEPMCERLQKQKDKNKPVRIIQQDDAGENKKL